MNCPALTRCAVKHLGGGAESDELAVEEPLEIRLGFGPLSDRQSMTLAITMRTPGDDEALATGFLLTEGLITRPDQIRSVGPCGEAPQGQSIRVELEPAVALDRQRLTRHFYTSSSCGVCGKTALDAVFAAGAKNLARVPLTISARRLKTWPERLTEQQTNFRATGGLHAAALFDPGGGLLMVREDIGRHNALDKLAGVAASAMGVPLSACGLLLSGRASFELLQKAVMMGIPLVAAIGAPSSLAVNSAEAFGITLVGFLRRDRGNVYTHSGRIVEP